MMPVTASGFAALVASCRKDRARRRDQRLLQVKPGWQAAGEKARGAVLAKGTQRFEHGQVVMGQPVRETEPRDILQGAKRSSIDFCPICPTSG
jgi:hypothetical protein